jgi:octanoyl-[GcvH]:protein N-octanoyltransferase
VQLLTAAFEDAALEAAVSHAVIDRVGAGELGETFRLARTPRTLSFGRLDTHVPGYPDAVRAAADQGFAAVHRLGGGRAAVFHEGTLAFGWAVPTDDPHAGTHERFAILAGRLRDALRSIGLDVHVGELAGEYCPGDYSLHLEGRVKVVGIAQRVSRRASYTEGMIVVTGGDAVRDVLVPVYAALGLEWDPATAGDCEGPSLEEVRDAVVARFEQEHALEAVPELDPATLALARRYAEAHDASDAQPARSLMAPR